MKKILRVLVELKGKMNDLTENQRVMSVQLDKLMKKESTDVESENVIDLPMLPIQNLEALNLVEKNLEVPAFHRKLVN